MKHTNYGIPYMGSKSKIVKTIISLFPKRRHFYDLFCGGCSVAHAAMLSHKYEHIHINDKDWRPLTLFKNAIMGGYRDERRWISRQDFFKLKDTDPYVAILWSFGNNMKNYLYAKEIERYKKALHYAIFFDDISLAAEFNLDFSFLENASNIRSKYMMICKYLKDIGKERDQTLQGLKRLQSLERLQRLQSLQSLERLERPESTCENYENVKIEDDSIIYCDIPYINTATYPTGIFDYERFYNWCEKQTQPVFISSYEMPSNRFKCAFEIPFQSKLNCYKTKKVIERIFIPRSQKVNILKELDLFDSLK